MRIIAILVSALFVSSVTAQSTVTVSNATDFLKAIGSNKTIYVSEGEYDLSAVTGVGSSNVTWEDEYDGSQILISGVSNLKIVGKGNARLMVAPQYTWVFKFTESNNVTIENVTMGHLTGGYCTGGVIYLDTCKNFKITGCKMFGSGTYGMQMERCDNITLEKSDVYKCTYGLLILNNSSNVNFIKTRFRETGEYDLISINNCKTVNFRTCTFENNYTSSSYMFRIDSDYNYYDYSYDYNYGSQSTTGSTGITVNTCTFRDNKVYYFSTDYGSKIVIGDNKFVGNDFGSVTPTANSKNKSTYNYNYYDY